LIKNFSDHWILKNNLIFFDIVNDNSVWNICQAGEPSLFCIFSFIKFHFHEYFEIIIENHINNLERVKCNYCGYILAIKTKKNSLVLNIVPKKEIAMSRSKQNYFVRFANLKKPKDDLLELS
jgi:hypothetical protein